MELDFPLSLSLFCFPFRSTSPENWMHYRAVGQIMLGALAYLPLQAPPTRHPLSLYGVVFRHKMIFSSLLNPVTSYASAYFRSKSRLFINVAFPKYKLGVVKHILARTCSQSTEISNPTTGAEFLD